MFRKFTKYELSKDWSVFLSFIIIQFIHGFVVHSIFDDMNSYAEQRHLMFFYFIVGIYSLSLRKTFTKELFSNSAYIIFSIPIRTGKLFLSKFSSIVIKSLIYCIFLGGIIYMFMLPFFEENVRNIFGWIGNPDISIVLSVIVPIFLIANIAILLVVNFSVALNTIYRGKYKILVGAFALALLIGAFFAYIGLMALIEENFSGLIKLLSPYMEIFFNLLPVFLFFYLPIYLLKNKLELT